MASPGLPAAVVNGREPIAQICAGVSREPAHSQQRTQMMRRHLALVCVTALLSILTLGVLSAGQPIQTVEIAGRITDTHFGTLPGARVTAVSGDDRAEVITGMDGRFSMPLPRLGTYVVTVELPGFLPATGTITLDETSRRAHLAWSLELGCLVEVQRVMFTVREAITVADAVAHIRVEDESEPVRWSGRPGCVRLNREYVAQTIGAVSLEGREPVSGPLLLLRGADETRLRVGEEYLLYFAWSPASGRFTVLGDELILPVREGRVVSRNAGELNGMAAEGALELLRTWARSPAPHLALASRLGVFNADRSLLGRHVATATE